MEWPLLADLDDALRQQVIASAARRRFGRSEVIFHEGDPGDTLHMVAKGRVAIRVSTRLGDRVTLAVLGVGEAFGELALVTPDARRTATAAALEPTETMALHRRDFEDLRAGSPAVERMLVAALANRVGRLTGHLLEALHEPADVRVVRRLHALMGDGDTVVGLTQDDLATLAGTTRPTTNRVLRALEDDGVIVLGRGRLEVVDPAALAHRAR